LEADGEDAERPGGDVLLLLLGLGVEGRVVAALCDMADGEYEAALGKWVTLREVVDDEMVGVNLAVCLLYVGRMQEVSPCFVWVSML
jgi:hypothetical protein